MTTTRVLTIQGVRYEISYMVGGGVARAIVTGGALGLQGPVLHETRPVAASAKHVAGDEAEEWLLLEKASHIAPWAVAEAVVRE